jgi:hypothetical protein
MRFMVARVWWIAVALTGVASLLACARVEDTQQPVATIAVTPVQPVADVGAPIEFSYRVTRVPGAALPDGLWVFVHLVDDTGTLLWTDDHKPPVPPSTWGAEPLEYQRTMFVPRLAYTGRVQVVAGLYEPPDGPRLRLTGMEQGDRSYAVAAFDVRPASNGVFVAFGDGWYGAERTPQEPLREWRWSAGDPQLSFRHPGGDAVLWLELDQPVAAVGTQRLEVRDGQTLLTTQAVTPGARQVVRVALPAGRAPGSPVALDLHVQPTFVPAAVSSLGSQDARPLGVRVFNVYVGRVAEGPQTRPETAPGRP